MADADKDALVSEFCSITGASPEKATQYLEANDWQMSAASNSYFQDEDEGGDTGAAGSAAPADYTGPRTLDGRPAPQAASRPARSAPAQPKRRGIATLGSLGAASAHDHHHDDDDDDDGDFEDDEDPNRGNLFAGGEKSGLAVQDPKQDGGSRKIISDILAKARENTGRNEPEAEAAQVPGRAFRGTGMTLGGDGVESREIPDPDGGFLSRRTGVPVERVLHVWQDGFSIDDGDLRRFDDPANQMDLQMIRAGRAPLHLMDVEHDQAVDVKLEQHDTPYTALPKKYRPFGGSGQRLGSPVPGEPVARSTAPAVSRSSAAASAGAAPSSPIPEIDASQPTVTIRLQLPDGTRLPARFNATNTIGDVYDFVARASVETHSRPWVLVTTFPNKEHEDKSLVLGDMSEFKKGGTAVVKWK